MRPPPMIFYILKSSNRGWIDRVRVMKLRRGSVGDGWKVSGRMKVPQPRTVAPILHCSF